MELANTLSLVEKCLEAISGKYDPAYSSENRGSPSIATDGHVNVSWQPRVNFSETRNSIVRWADVWQKISGKGSAPLRIDVGRDWFLSAKKPEIALRKLVLVDCQLAQEKGKMKGSTKSQEMDEPFSR